MKGRRLFSIWFSKSGSLMVQQNRFGNRSLLRPSGGLSCSRPPSSSFTTKSQFNARLPGETPNGSGPEHEFA